MRKATRIGILLLALALGCGAALSAGAEGKRDCREALEQAGFEIVSAAKKLQDFFTGETL